MRSVTDAFYGCERLPRKPVLVIYSYCKDGVFTAVKKGCSVQNYVCERGTICHDRVYEKGYLFCLKWYIQRVRGWSLGQSLFV